MTKTEELAKEMIATLADYPESDPYEVLDELMKIISTEENLSKADESAIREIIWSKGF